MATVAAIRAASSVFACPSASPSSFSVHNSSADCRLGPQFSLKARPCSAAVGFSYSPFCSSQSIALLPRLIKSRTRVPASPRCESDGNADDGKIPFGYTRKDVIFIGVGLLGFGVGLKYGLEFLGVDSIKAGNAVQLIMVLGLTIGWISTYIFRVSSKEMTYAKQLKDYENKVMQKRLEELPEAELETMLAQVEEEKKALRENRERLR